MDLMKQQNSVFGNLFQSFYLIQNKITNIIFQNSHSQTLHPHAQKKRIGTIKTNSVGAHRVSITHRNKRTIFQFYQLSAKRTLSKLFSPFHSPCLFYWYDKSQKKKIITAGRVGEDATWRNTYLLEAVTVEGNRSTPPLVIGFGRAV